MALEDIINRIINDAKKNAADIESEARAKAYSIMDEVKAKAKSAKANALAEAKDEAKKEEKRVVSLARLEARNTVLSQKRAVMDDVFNEALKQLKSLPDDKYCDLIKKMILRAVTEGDEELILSSVDKKKVGNNFINEINVALKTQGKKGELVFSKETRDIEGGFILKKGKVEFNNSFSALIEMVRESLEPKIAGILFKPKE
ncbi:V-type ATP synthase subunit E family protein [Candidatus Oleimmundimicrobium sp.]|uniref:V-type ATP synthase subunit E n=1 Tax=Candidatus Oleimmundimicrobium sp. TaxID=3060597 RepID=UPI00271663D4|nr:V-type ATP synthase subunit E family protein [Candidatus Oleimmundimicrobium sp.]MDO8886286.1 V-type ATP synthase subunit E family protein [Candidatus Oleimmundimicrobium sp.]